ncbi:MAG TPA: phosphate acetyltransferase [Atribacteraceae bacterium]|nr:phosphate acetyltransferase [Atribacteraceae bacterium]
MNQLETIRNRAKAIHKTVVLPESTDERVLQAAESVTRQGIASVKLLGDREEVREKAAEHGIDLTGIDIVEYRKEAKRSQYTEDLLQLRKSKAMTPEQAEQWLLNPMYYACMMLRESRVDGVVAGAVLPSPNVIKPALQIIKTAPGVKIASSCFLMSVPNCPYGEDGVFFYADCGFVPEPNAEELAHIALTTARTAELLLGIEPRLAMLSFSTKGSTSHPLVDKVVEATRIARSLNPRLSIDGELQADAAIVPDVAAKKSPDSTVAGRANVLIFPDLNAGNICCKLTERLAKATAIGPILQGLAKPVNDLSRGCKAEDIVDQVAVTVLQTRF